MTFPSPFSPGEPPGLDAVVEASGYDRQSVQQLADKLTQTVADATADDKLKLRQRKGNMTKAVQSPTRKDRRGVFDPVVNKLLAGVQTAYQDDDAELMSILPRLGAGLTGGVDRQSTQTAAGQTGPIGPGLGGDPATLGYYPGSCVGPIGDPNGPAPGSPPPGMIWVHFPEGWFYCNPYSGPSTGGEVVPPPPPPVVPPPPTTPPPTTLPPPTATLPGPVILGPAPCPVGLPAGAVPQAVYIVPWLSEDTTSASAFSECGLKQIADAQAPLVPAAPIAAALSRAMGYVDVVPALDDSSQTVLSGRAE